MSGSSFGISSFGTSLSGSSLWLNLQGAVNVRDVGGLPVTGGGRTRCGVLIRSDLLHDLTSSDVVTLVHGIGIRQVIDLRAPSERDGQPVPPLVAAGVAHVELAVLTDEMLHSRRTQRVSNDDGAAGDANSHPARRQAESYMELLECGGAAFVAGLAHVAGPEGTPSIVHCAAGKDRTGVLVALLLDAAGVRREAIVADYAASASRLELIWAKLSAMGSYAEFAAQAPAASRGADAATMEIFLAGVQDRFGGAAAWFLAAGASPRDLATWRQRILVL
ncbi:MAG: tyrosine-protein phosphatase [Acidimicrobiales bacterium]